MEALMAFKWATLAGYDIRVALLMGTLTACVCAVLVAGATTVVTDDVEMGVQWPALVVAALVLEEISVCSIMPKFLPTVLATSLPPALTLTLLVLTTGDSLRFVRE
jgi:hypothetical protein